MRNSIKRALALVLALVMILSFAACGKQAESTNTPADAPKATEGPKENETANGAAAEAEKEYALGSWVVADDPASISGTVRFWIPFKGSQGMDDMIAAFNAIYPNITVELNTYNNNTDGNMQVNTAIMMGEVDVLASFGLHQTHSRWENDLFVDLTDYIEKYNIDMVKEWGTDAYAYDGTFYSLPCGGLTYFIAVNMNAWNEAGLGELPTEWTWDEYLAASAAMTKKNDDGTIAVYGGSDNGSIEYSSYPWYQVYGENYVYSLDGNESNFTDPLIINSLKREIKAEQEDQIWFPLLTYRDNKVNQQDVYVVGTVASAVSNNLLRFLRDTENYPTDFTTGFAPYPVEEKGQDNHMAGVSCFSHAGITIGCQDEEAAWAFLAWYSTYGAGYLPIAGHAPTWKGTDASNLLSLIFGSEEEAAKIIDVDSFKRVLYNYEAPSYVDTNTYATSEVVALLKEYIMEAHRGNMSVEDAMATAKELADEEIKKAME